MVGSLTWNETKPISQLCAIWCIGEHANCYQLSFSMCEDTQKPHLPLHVDHANCYKLWHSPRGQRVPTLREALFECPMYGKKMANRMSYIYAKRCTCFLFPLFCLALSGARWNKPISVNWHIQHVEGHVFEVELHMLNMPIATNLHIQHVWKKWNPTGNQHVWSVSKKGGGKWKKNVTWTKALCLVTGSLKVHRNRGQFSVEQDLLPLLMSLSCCVDMSLLPSNGVLKSTQKQKFLWWRPAITACSRFCFQSI